MYREFDKNQLETQYSPSSCVDDIMVYINQYIHSSANNLDVAKVQDAVLENIAYGEDEDERIDLFLPFADTRWQKKLQVYIHGGYWQELSKNESSFAANNFQSHGCHFAVVNYSLAPKANMSEIVEQNRQALVYLYRNAERLGYNKEEIYLSGSSAGGHLCLMMALTDWRQYGEDLPADLVKGVCAVSGVYDLEPIALTYVNNPLNLSANEIRQFSPLRHITQPLCPMILAFGDNETSEFKRHSLEMLEAIEKVQGETPFAEIHGRNHFNVILDLGDRDTWLFKQVAVQMGLF